MLRGRAVRAGGLTLPVAEYDHDAGCSIVGGVVVHDPGVPGIDGRYLFSDYCSGTFWTIDPDGDALREPEVHLRERPGHQRHLARRGRDGPRDGPQRRSAAPGGQRPVRAPVGHPSRKVTVTDTLISVVPAWTGVAESASIIRAALGCG